MRSITLRRIFVKPAVWTYPSLESWITSELNHSHCEHDIMKAMNVPVRPHLMSTTVQIRGNVERVRSRILAWALDLEDRGVLGEGMTQNVDSSPVGTRTLQVVKVLRSCWCAGSAHRSPIRLL